MILSESRGAAQWRVGQSKVMRGMPVGVNSTGATQRRLPHFADFFAIGIYLVLPLMILEFLIFQMPTQLSNL